MTPSRHIAATCCWRPSTTSLPDVVMIEAFPFGRRQVRFELLPLLDAIAAAHPRPLTVTSVRDILQENRKPGRDEESLALVQAHFDLVFVHGDPGFVRLEETFPLATQIAERIVYTGLVAPPPPAPSSEHFDIVVSAGGGAVGAALIRAAAEAAACLPDTLRWCLIAGPNLPQAEFDAIAALAPASATLVRFRRDFASLLAGAQLSVSQAGYNTVCDVLVAGCRALLLPFAAGGETEQTVRAERLQRLGLAKLLPEDRLNADTMTDMIRDCLQSAAPPRHQLDLDGAAHTALLLRRLLTAPTAR